MTMFKRNMLSFHLNNDLSNQMLQVLCKGMKQRPTFNYDYGHQRIFPQFECYFVKIVIEWLRLWWNQLFVLILNVMSLLVM